MRHDTEAFLLLLRQRASSDADLAPWWARNEERVAGVMDTVLSARGDDAGRFIGGARKDRGMFTQMLVTAGVITAANLAALEAQGEEAAYKEVTRDKLIPKRTAAALKALGDTAPVAYLKIALRDMITPRPYNSPEARSKYVESANVVNFALDTAYTDAGAFMRYLQLNYLYRIAKGDPDAVMLTHTQLVAAVPSGTASYDRARTYAAQQDFSDFDSRNYNNETFYFFTHSPRRYTRVRETDEEKKNRESIEKPLGSRFYEAVDQGLRYYDKTAWDRTIYEYRKMSAQDWSWANLDASSTTVAEIPEDQRAEPLTREEVIPPPDCAQMREAGDSAGAAYLYVWAYKTLLPKKSLGTKAARAAYETALNAFDLAMSGDRKDKRTIPNLLYGIRYAKPEKAVLPIEPLSPDILRAVNQYTRQEGFLKKSDEERARMRLEFLSDELGVPVDSTFPGRWYAKGESAPLYYRVALPKSDVDALVQERDLTNTAIAATSNDLLLFLNGNWTDKMESVYKKAWMAGWNDVEALCLALNKDIEGRKGGRFTEPERGVLGPRTGPTVPGPHTSDTIKATTGLYAVEYGRWMNEVDKETVNTSAAEALHDFAEVLDVPLRAVSLNGRLALAFGSRGQGKASAHYEPFKKVINMTRTRGSGALAHEWGHALDHWFADSGQSSRIVKGKLDSYFATLLDGTGGMQGVDVTPEERKAINDALMGVTDILLAGKKEYDDARKRRWREEHPHVHDRPRHPRDTGAWQFDNYFRARVGLPDYYSPLPAVRPTPDAGWMPGDAEHVDALYRWEAAKKARNEAETILLQTLADNGRNNPMLKASEAAGEYWQQNIEMFARAWESFIEDSLTKKKRYSGYLVRGTTPYAVYPQGEQRERLFTAFTTFLDTLRPVLRRLAVRPNGRVRRRRSWEARR